MPSVALTKHYGTALAEAEALGTAHDELRTTVGPDILVALNRAMIVAAVAAWQAYIEELLRESVAALRGTGSPLWPVVDGLAAKKLEQFSTPSADKVRDLFAECLVLPDLPAAWAWPGTTAPAARMVLGDILKQRHRIAHGARPAAAIVNRVAVLNLTFVNQLARATDAAVRLHLGTTFALPNP